MDEIEALYEELDTEEVSLGEFREAVDARVRQADGQLEELRAAKLLAHELTGAEVDAIETVDPLMESVSLAASALSVGEVHTFEREDPDQPDGRVLNATLGDATGSVRVSFWDELAESAAEELDPGDTLKLKGRPKSGEEGLEIAADKVGPLEEGTVELDPIQEIYLDLETDAVGLDAFREQVETKVEEMGGLADEETAAKLIAHDLQETTVDCVDDVQAGMEEATITVQVLDVGDLRTFERDDPDRPDGQVLNVDAADETGRIRLSFWDEQAGTAQSDLEPGDVVEVTGRPKDGYDGIEVSVGEFEPAPDVDVEVENPEEWTVEDLRLGASDVNLVGEVLGTEPIRTFDRDDGSEGRVANLLLGDATGRVRVTLWDDRADVVESVDRHEVVEIVDGYVRERDGSTELHVGDRGAVESVEGSVTYDPETTDIAAVAEDETVDIAGVVRSADPKRTFDRDDGSEGQVRNVRLQDGTDDIRVALWGEKADLNLGPGDEVLFVDVAIQDGWQDDLEASANWQTTVVPLEDGVVDETSSDTADVGLAAFESADEERSSSESETAFRDDRSDSKGTESPDDAREVEFTGTVVQAGNPIILDDGAQTVTVQTDLDVTLGEELTVAGELADGVIDPDRTERPDR